jgi:hypothetical protein
MHYISNICMDGGMYIVFTSSQVSQVYGRTDGPHDLARRGVVLRVVLCRDSDTGKSLRSEMIAPSFGFSNVSSVDSRKLCNSY